MYLYAVLDEVEVNYAGCGSWYFGHIVEITQTESEDKSSDTPLHYSYKVMYEDGSEEIIDDGNNIRPLIGSALALEHMDDTNLINATSSSDDNNENNNTDDPLALTEEQEEEVQATEWDQDELTCPVDRYLILGGLAQLLKTNDPGTAIAYFTEAAEGAMDAGKMTLAMEFSKCVDELSSTLTERSD